MTNDNTAAHDGTLGRFRAKLADAIKTAFDDGIRPTTVWGLLDDATQEMAKLAWGEE